MSGTKCMVKIECDDLPPFPFLWESFRLFAHMRVCNISFLENIGRGLCRNRTGTVPSMKKGDVQKATQSHRWPRKGTETSLITLVHRAETLLGSSPLPRPLMAPFQGAFQSLVLSSPCCSRAPVHGGGRGRVSSIAGSDAQQVTEQMQTC